MLQFDDCLYGRRLLQSVPDATVIGVHSSVVFGVS